MNKSKCCNKELSTGLHPYCMDCGTDHDMYIDLIKDNRVMILKTDIGKTEEPGKNRRK